MDVEEAEDSPTKRCNEVRVSETTSSLAFPFNSFNKVLPRYSIDVAPDSKL